MEQNLNIWQKLFLIQSQVKSFINKENNNTSYCEIIENIKEEMNKHRLIMTFNVLNEQHEMIEYPIYEVINGDTKKIDKKEILSTITVSYCFIDTETREQTNEFTMITSGVNGTDKSIITALNTAEKYIFLKFFHIPIDDNIENIYAKDLPNLSNNINLNELQNLSNSQIIESLKTGNPLQEQPININQYIEQLANFDINTPSYQNIINQISNLLNQQGYDLSDGKIINTIMTESHNLRLTGTYQPIKL